MKRETLRFPFGLVISYLAVSWFGTFPSAIYAASVMADDGTDQQETSYGVDVSFPIFHSVSTNYPSKSRLSRVLGGSTPIQPLGNRQELYRKHLEGCRNAYQDNAESCDLYEYTRMTMNLRQPSSMVNYTKHGFQKIKAPDNIVDLISRFWRQNHYKGKEEAWPSGNTYVNHWDAPTFLISVDDKGLRGSGPALKKSIWSASASLLEEWTGQELQPCSMYGIRVYGEGSIMLPHVDRLPLVASAMIPVAQKVDEPWPLEVYDHDGIAHNVTMEPGEMLLFESHSVIHGHPFPLKGEFVALLFMHFEPTGRPLFKDGAGVFKIKASTEEQEIDAAPKVVESDSITKATSMQAANDKYKASVEKGLGGPSASDDQINLPPYIQRESKEEANWRKRHPKGWSPPTKILPSTAHLAAKTGNLEKLVQELQHSRDEGNTNDELLSQRDENGWQVLHEGVASGNKDVVELLVQHGANINTRTHGGYGESPLRIAEKWHGENHPIVRYLKSLGALSLGPEL